uniref:Uncharacterized protein n=1 Tax=Chromera velia CCMP2878 TaxID=1169474 RepID=A0A0G4HCP0_9ALVE|eukprot:Cvel_938.t1-p1 / transcript=Cvel_938.t1 / gene=Cvel_938 / organism=Chromera_velia_CCMP2878 / gene_product=hypothetical protein / transcript_product=hypothetical protein / location=Cvel_scaffold30:21458-59237(+) / protein_length=5809 / sequence_SO=supercontig / SO=protein_coding / is_pseudo=false
MAHQSGSTVPSGAPAVSGHQIRSLLEAFFEWTAETDREGVLSGEGEGGPGSPRCFTREGSVYFLEPHEILELVVDRQILPKDGSSVPSKERKSGPKSLAALSKKSEFLHSAYANQTHTGIPVFKAAPLSLLAFGDERVLVKSVCGLIPLPPLHQFACHVPFRSHRWGFFEAIANFFKKLWEGLVAAVETAKSFFMVFIGGWGGLVGQGVSLFGNAQSVLHSTFEKLKNLEFVRLIRNIIEGVFAILNDFANIFNYFALIKNICALASNREMNLIIHSIAIFINALRMPSTLARAVMEILRLWFPQLVEKPKEEPTEPFPEEGNYFSPFRADGVGINSFIYLTTGVECLFRDVDFVGETMTKEEVESACRYVLLKKDCANNRHVQCWGAVFTRALWHEADRLARCEEMRKAGTGIGVGMTMSCGQRMQKLRNGFGILNWFNLMHWSQNNPKDICNEDTKEDVCGPEAEPSPLAECLEKCRSSTNCHYASATEGRGGAISCTYYRTVAGLRYSAGTSAGRASCGAPESRLAILGKVPLSISAVSNPISFQGALLSTLDSEGDGAEILGRFGFYQDPLEIDCSQAAVGTAESTPEGAWVLSGFSPPVTSILGENLMTDLWVTGSYTCALATNVRSCKEETIKVKGRKFDYEKAGNAGEEANAAAKDFLEAQAEMEALYGKWQAQCGSKDFRASYSAWCAANTETPHSGPLDESLIYNHTCCGGGEGAGFYSVSKADPVMGIKVTTRGSVRTMGPGKKCEDAAGGMIFPEDYMEFCNQAREEYDGKKSEVSDLKQTMLKKSTTAAKWKTERAGMLELIGGHAICPEGQVLQKFSASADGQSIEIIRKCCAVSSGAVGIQPLSHAYMPPTMRVTPDVLPWEGEYCASKRDETGRMTFKSCASFISPQDGEAEAYGRNTLAFDPARMQWCLHGVDVPDGDPICLDSMAAHPAQAPAASAASPGGNRLGVIQLEDMVAAPALPGEPSEILEKPKKPEKPPPPKVVKLKPVNIEDFYSPHCKAHDPDKPQGPLVKDLPEDISSEKDLEKTEFWKAATEPLPKEDEEDPDEYLFGGEEPAELGSDNLAADPCGMVLSAERSESMDVEDESMNYGIPFRAIAGCTDRVEEREGAMGDATQAVEDTKESVQMPYDIATSIWSYIGSLTEFSFAPWGLGIEIDPFDQVMQLAEFVWDKVATSLDNKVSDIESGFGELQGQDCDSTSYALAKALCDISCVSDAVRTGNRVIMDRLQEVYDKLLQNMLTYMDYHASYAEALMQWLADLQDWHAQELGKKIQAVADAQAAASSSLLRSALVKCKASLPPSPGRLPLASTGPQSDNSTSSAEAHSSSSRMAMLQCVSQALGVGQNQENCSDELCLALPGDTEGGGIWGKEVDGLATRLHQFRAEAEKRLGSLPCVGTNLHPDCRSAETQRSVASLAKQTLAHARQLERRTRERTDRSVGALESLSQKLQQQKRQTAADSVKAGSVHPEDAVHAVLKEVHGHHKALSRDLDQHMKLLNTMGVPEAEGDSHLGLSEESRQLQQKKRVSARVSEGDLQAFRADAMSGLDRLSSALSTLEREVQMWALQCPHTRTKVTQWAVSHRQRQSVVQRHMRLQKTEGGVGAQQSEETRLEEMMKDLKADEEMRHMEEEGHAVALEMDSIAESFKTAHSAVELYLEYARSHLGEKRNVREALQDYLACSDAEPYSALSDRWAALRREEAQAARLLVRAWWTATTEAQRILAKLVSVQLPVRLARLEMDAASSEPLSSVHLLIGVLPSEISKGPEGDTQLLSASLCDGIQEGEETLMPSKSASWMQRAVRAALSSGSLGQLLDFGEELVEVIDFLQARMSEEKLWHPANKHFSSLVLSAVKETGAQGVQGAATVSGPVSLFDTLPSAESRAATEDSVFELEQQLHDWRSAIGGGARKGERKVSRRRRAHATRTRSPPVLLDTSVTSEHSSASLSGGVKAALELVEQAQKSAEASEEGTSRGTKEDGVASIDSLLKSWGFSLQSALCSGKGLQHFHGGSSALEILRRAEKVARQQRKREAPSDQSDALRTREISPANSATVSLISTSSSSDSEELIAVHKRDLPVGRAPSSGGVQAQKAESASASPLLLDHPLSLLQTAEEKTNAQDPAPVVPPPSNGPLDSEEGMGEFEGPALPVAGDETSIQRVKKLRGQCLPILNEKAPSLAPLFSSLSCALWPGSVLTSWTVESCGSEMYGGGRLAITCTKIDKPPQQVTKNGEASEDTKSKEDVDGKYELPEPEEMHCSEASVSGNTQDQSPVALSNLPPLECPGSSVMRGLSLSTQPGPVRERRTVHAWTCVAFDGYWMALHPELKCDGVGKLAPDSPLAYCHSRDPHKEECMKTLTEDECFEDIKNLHGVRTAVHCRHPPNPQLDWCEDLARAYCAPPPVTFTLRADCCSSSGTAEELPKTTYISGCPLTGTGSADLFAAVDPLVCKGKGGTGEVEGQWGLSGFQVVPCNDTPEEETLEQKQAKRKFAVRYTCTFLDLVNEVPFTSADPGCHLPPKPAGVSVKQWARRVEETFEPPLAGGCGSFLKHGPCAPFAGQPASAMVDFDAACGFPGFSLTAVSFESCGYEEFPAYGQIVTACAAMTPPLQITDAWKKADAEGLPRDDPSAADAAEAELLSSVTCMSLQTEPRGPSAVLDSLAKQPMRCPTGWYLAGFAVESVGSAPDINKEASAAGTPDDGHTTQPAANQFIYTCCKSAATLSYSATLRRETKCDSADLDMLADDSGRLELLYRQLIRCPPPMLLTELELVPCFDEGSSVPSGVRSTYECRAPMVLPPSVETSGVLRGVCKKLEGKHAAAMVEDVCHEEPESFVAVTEEDNAEQQSGYKVICKNVNFEEARDACIQEGRTLAKLSTMAKAKDAAAAMLAACGGHATAYVDGSDVEHEGIWKYTDGTKKYWSPWNPGEPNNAGGNEDCIQFGQGPASNDLPCTTRLNAAICDPPAPKKPKVVCEASKSNRECPPGAYLSGFGFEACDGSGEDFLVSDGASSQWRRTAVCGGMQSGHEKDPKCEEKTSEWTSGVNTTELSKEMEAFTVDCGRDSAVIDIRLEKEKPDEDQSKVRLAYKCCPLPEKVKGLPVLMESPCEDLEAGDATAVAKAMNVHCGGPELVLQSFKVEECPGSPPLPGEETMRMHRFSYVCALLLDVRWAKDVAPSKDKCTFQSGSQVLKGDEWQLEEAASDCMVLKQDAAFCRQVSAGSARAGLLQVSGEEMAVGCPFPGSAASLYLMAGAELRKCGALDDFMSPSTACVHSRAFLQKKQKTPVAASTPAPSSLVSSSSSRDVSVLPVRCETVKTRTTGVPSPSTLVDLPSACPQGLFMQSRQLETKPVRPHSFIVPEDGIDHAPPVKCENGLMMSIDEASWENNEPGVKCKEDVTRMAVEKCEGLAQCTFSKADIPAGKCNRHNVHIKNERAFHGTFRCLSNLDRRQKVTFCDSQSAVLSCDAGKVVRVLKAVFREKKSPQDCMAVDLVGIKKTVLTEIHEGRSQQTARPLSFAVTREQAHSGSANSAVESDGSEGSPKWAIRERIRKTFKMREDIVDFDLVAAECDRKGVCVFPPTADFFGVDPYPRKDKAVEVHFVCEQPFDETDLTVSTRCCGSPDLFGAVQREETESRCVPLEGLSVVQMRGLLSICPASLKDPDGNNLVAAMTGVRMETCAPEGTFRLRTLCQGVGIAPEGALTVIEGKECKDVNLAGVKSLSEVFNPFFPASSDGWACPLGRFISFGAAVEKGCAGGKGLRLVHGCTSGSAEPAALKGDQKDKPEDLFECAKRSTRQGMASCPRNALLAQLSVDAHKSGDGNLPFFKYECCKQKGTNAPRTYPSRSHSTSCVSPDGILKQLMASPEVKEEVTEYYDPKTGELYDNPYRIKQTTEYVVKGPCGFPRMGISKRLPAAYSTQMGPPEPKESGASLLQMEEKEETARSGGDSGSSLFSNRTLLAGASETYDDHDAAAVPSEEHHLPSAPAEESLLSSVSSSASASSSSPSKWQGFALKEHKTAGCSIVKGNGRVATKNLESFPVECPQEDGWLNAFQLMNQQESECPDNQSKMSWECASNWRRGECFEQDVSILPVEGQAGRRVPFILGHLDQLKGYVGCPAGAALAGFRVEETGAPSLLQDSSDRRLFSKHHHKHRIDFESHASQTLRISAVCQPIERGVDGGFSDWGDWSKCSLSCQQFRFRSCTNPRPSRGGLPCPEGQETFQVRACQEKCVVGESEPEEELKVGQVDPLVGPICSAESGFFLGGASQQSCGMSGGQELVQSVHTCRLPLDIENFPPRKDMPPVTCTEHRSPWYVDMKGPAGFVECPSTSVMENLRWLTKGGQAYVPLSKQIRDAKCEDTGVLELSCPRREGVKIIDAHVYGPEDEGAVSVCPIVLAGNATRLLKDSGETCESHFVKDAVAQHCDGRRLCKLKVDAGNLGIPKCAFEGLRTLRVRYGCHSVHPRSRLLYSCCDLVDTKSKGPLALHKMQPSEGSESGLPLPSTAIFDGGVFHSKFFESECFPEKDASVRPLGETDEETREDEELQSAFGELSCPHGYFLQGYKVKACGAGERKFVYKCLLVDRREWVARPAHGKASGVCGPTKDAAARFQFDCGTNGFLCSVGFEGCTEQTAKALALLTSPSFQTSRREAPRFFVDSPTSLLQNLQAYSEREAEAEELAETSAHMKVNGMCAGVDVPSKVDSRLTSHCLDVRGAWSSLPGNALEGDADTLGLSILMRMQTAHCLRDYGDGEGKKSGLMRDLRLEVSKDGTEARFAYKCCLSSREFLMGRKAEKKPIYSSRSACVPVSRMRGAVPEGLNFGCNGGNSGYALTMFTFEPCVPTEWWQPRGWFRAEFTCAAADWTALDSEMIPVAEQRELPVDDTLNDCEVLHHTCETRPSGTKLNGKDACEEAQKCRTFCGKVKGMTCRFLKPRRRRTATSFVGQKHRESIGERGSVALATVMQKREERSTEMSGFHFLSLMRVSRTPHDLMQLLKLKEKGKGRKKAGRSRRNLRTTPAPPSSLSNSLGSGIRSKYLAVADDSGDSSGGTGDDDDDGATQDDSTVEGAEEDEEEEEGGEEDEEEEEDEETTIAGALSGVFSANPADWGENLKDLWENTKALGNATAEAFQDYWNETEYYFKELKENFMEDPLGTAMGFFSDTSEFLEGTVIGEIAGEVGTRAKDKLDQVKGRAVDKLKGREAGATYKMQKLREEGFEGTDEELQEEVRKQLAREKLTAERDAMDKEEAKSKGVTVEQLRKDKAREMGLSPAAYMERMNEEDDQTHLQNEEAIALKKQTEQAAEEAKQQKLDARAQELMTKNGLTEMEARQEAEDEAARVATAADEAAAKKKGELNKLPQADRERLAKEGGYATVEEWEADEAKKSSEEAERTQKLDEDLAAARAKRDGVSKEDALKQIHEEKASGKTQAELDEEWKNKKDAETTERLRQLEAADEYNAKKAGIPVEEYRTQEAAKQNPACGATNAEACLKTRRTEEIFNKMEERETAYRQETREARLKKAFEDKIATATADAEKAARVSEASADATAASSPSDETDTEKDKPASGAGDLTPREEAIAEEKLKEAEEAPTAAPMSEEDSKALGEEMKKSEEWEKEKVEKETERKQDEVKESYAFESAMGKKDDDDDKNKDKKKDENDSDDNDDSKKKQTGGGDDEDDDKKTKSGTTTNDKDQGTKTKKTTSSSAGGDGGDDKSSRKRSDSTPGYQRDTVSSKAKQKDKVTSSSTKKKGGGGSGGSKKKGGKGGGGGGKSRKTGRASSSSCRKKKLLQMDSKKKTVRGQQRHPSFLQFPDFC